MHVIVLAAGDVERFSIGRPDDTAVAVGDPEDLTKNGLPGRNIEYKHKLAGVGGIDVIVSVIRVSCEIQVVAAREDQHSLTVRTDYRGLSVVDNIVRKAGKWCCQELVFRVGRRGRRNVSASGDL